MVKLSLLAAKGNAARYFPHQGFLALTPLKLEGHVRTRLDDDRKPIQASDIFVAVRCYEARISRTGVSHTNILVDHRVPLWSKPDDVPWADVGDGDWPFRLVLPPHLAGHSTAHYQEYRVFWRIEAVLNHIPTFGVGHRQVKTFDLPLLRYDAGVALPPAPSAWALAHGAKGAPALRYLITTPPLPLGPTDLVPVALKLAPVDPRARVAALALIVERRLEFNDAAAGGPDDTSLASTTNLLERAAPRGAAKAATFLVASGEASSVPRDEHGVYAKTVTLQIPTQKSASHWAVGETMRTALVTLRFFLHVKVTLAHGAGGGAGETVALGARELCLVATNESQRRLALAKAGEGAERARAHDAAGDVGRAKTAKSARRPHTSAGLATPRAKSLRRARHAASAERAGDEAGDGEEAALSAPPGKGMFAGLEGPGPSTPLAVEWEEELERIAAASRRRSVEMLGFGERRTRPRIDVHV